MFNIPQRPAEIIEEDTPPIEEDIQITEVEQEGRVKYLKLETTHRTLASAKLNNSLATNGDSTRETQAMIFQTVADKP